MYFTVNRMCHWFPYGMPQIVVTFCGMLKACLRTFSEKAFHIASTRGHQSDGNGLHAGDLPVAGASLQHIDDRGDCGSPGMDLTHAGFADEFGHMGCPYPSSRHYRQSARGRVHKLFQCGAALPGCSRPPGGEDSRHP